MQRFTQRAVMLFTLLSLPSAVLAGTTYNIQNYSYPGAPIDQNGWTLTGTITTDGTQGFITAADITSWTWTVTMGENKITEIGTSATVYGLIMASSTDITIAPPYVTGAYGLYADLLLVGGGFALGWQYNIGLGEWATLYSCDSAEDPYYPWNIYTGPNVGMPPPWIIASVPDPSTLYLLGFGAVCGCVYVMGHKRRERRTATTVG